MMANSLGLKAAYDSVIEGPQNPIDLTSILNGNIEQNQMRQLHGMNGHRKAFPQIAPPVLICRLVVDAILQVVREKVLDLDWRTQLHVDLGTLSNAIQYRESQKSDMTYLISGSFRSASTWTWNRKGASFSDLWAHLTVRTFFAIRSSLFNAGDHL
jgi:hypothetical protein